MSIPARTIGAISLAFALLPASLSAQEQVGAAREPAPTAVVLSNGQRWERISLRHIDARVLASLLGATVLPTAEPAWTTGALGTLSGPHAPWSPSGAMLYALFQQGGVGLPIGGGGFGAPAGAAPANPAGLPVLIDPVTNAVIVDP